MSQKITHIEGDINDVTKLNEVFKKYQPEIIFHMAAQSLVRYSYKEPVETYQTNVMGTINILEAARNTKSVKVILNITSDKCYENKEIDYAYAEDDPMGGYDPYSSSKGCAELVTAAYRNSFLKDTDLSLTSVRAGNVVGGGDWAEDRIVPDCIRALQNDQPIIVRNLKAVRPWQHVLEPLSGYLWLGSCAWNSPHLYDGAWNFGPKDSNNIEVHQVVESIIDNWGSGSWLTQTSNDQFHEAGLLKLSFSKAKKKLGWTPIYDKDQTFRATVKWYKSFFDKANAQDLTLKDIEGYVNEAKDKQAVWAISKQKAGVV